MSHHLAITEEVITKRKTELTTTKQIETRIKRQVKFEDGKVIEDSGPVVSTASKFHSCYSREQLTILNSNFFTSPATEDTDKVESEQVEKKTVPPTGSHDVIDGPESLEFTSRKLSESSPRENLIPFSTNDSINRSYVASRDDGLIREIKENRVVSREDTIKLTEVEDVNHLGDFSDAVSSRYIFHFFNTNKSRRIVCELLIVSRMKGIYVYVEMKGFGISYEFIGYAYMITNYEFHG